MPRVLLYLPDPSQGERPHAARQTIIYRRDPVQPPHPLAGQRAGPVTRGIASPYFNAQRTSYPSPQPLPAGARRDVLPPSGASPERLSARGPYSRLGPERSTRGDFRAGGCPAEGRSLCRPRERPELRGLVLFYTEEPLPVSTWLPAAYPCLWPPRHAAPAHRVDALGLQSHLGLSAQLMRSTQCAPRSGGLMSAPVGL